ncbi:CinA family protein [Actinomyces trachealis]|uniref:CinA family protein n=1 Tax=Actinomyces trachealis TaxID=2763540 RepID=UPI001892C72F|nr:CinA family protein [Actinomyces trachealis]
MTGPVSAHRLLELAQARGLHLAVAESLTGGLLADAVVSVPGASAVMRGAVVAYATELKAQLLGVDPELLARTGPVHAEVAKQMAVGVARLMGADLGLATTGVAGPGPADGYQAGTVHVAAWSEWGVLHRELHLSGGRQQVRDSSVLAALKLGVALLEANGARV